MRHHIAQYLSLLTERRELAFLRWQVSGCRDFAVHDEYLHWRDRVTAATYANRACRQIK